MHKNDKLDKIISEIIENLRTDAQVGSRAYEQQKAKLNYHLIKLMSKSIEDLNRSIDRASKSSERLSKILIWLNFIIVLATVAMIVIPR